jgi:hypothetical protein
LKAVSEHENRPEFHVADCDAGSDSLSALITMSNISLLGVRFIVDHKNHYSEAFKECLQPRKSLKTLQMRLAHAPDRFGRQRVSNFLVGIVPYFSNLVSLELSGPRRMSWDALLNANFENLKSLSITGKDMIRAVVEGHNGRLSGLEELKLSTRESKDAEFKRINEKEGFETMNHYQTIKQYYTGDESALCRFFAATPLLRLTMSGFPAKIVLEVLKSMEKSLVHFEFHDLNISVSYAANNISFDDDNDDGDDDSSKQIPEEGLLAESYGQVPEPRWQFLKGLSQKARAKISRVHYGNSMDILKRISLFSLPESIGFDIERQYLVTHTTELRRPESLDLRYFVERTWNHARSRWSNIRNQRIEGCLHKLQNLHDFKANFELLNHLQSMPNLQEIYFHVVAINASQYWDLTAREAVETFAYIKSRRGGHKLLKIHLADTCTLRRYLVRYIGSGKVITHSMRLNHTLESHIWSISQSPVQWLYATETKPWNPQFVWENLWAWKV